MQILITNKGQKKTHETSKGSIFNDIKEFSQTEDYPTKFHPLCVYIKLFESRPSLRGTQIPNLKDNWDKLTKIFRKSSPGRRRSRPSIFIIPLVPEPPSDSG